MDVRPLWIQVALAEPAQVGAQPMRQENAALEANVTYQYDSHSSTREILALNAILHVFFDASRTP
jgi:hypothetical protein